MAPSLQVAKYWGMVEWFDETVGDLLNHLDEQKLTENTIVIYVADNGWITDPKTGGYAPKSKQSQYEGGLRTPIMVRWTGHVKPERSQALASSLDIAPTFLAVARLQPTPRCPGSTYLIGSVCCSKDDRRRVLHSRFNRTQQSRRQLALAMDDRRQLEVDRSGFTRSTKRQSRTIRLGCRSVRRAKPRRESQRACQKNGRRPECMVGRSSRQASIALTAPAAARRGAGPSRLLPVSFAASRRASACLPRVSPGRSSAGSCAGSGRSPGR